MSVKLISITQPTSEFIQDLILNASVEEKEEYTKFMSNIYSNPEALMIYIARVSSPKQTNPDYSRLLNYCAKHSHWSVFEHITVTVEIETNVAIATQILRHRSAKFQQLSRRYSSDNVEFTPIIPRRQDWKNRQNSINDLEEETVKWFKEAQESVNSLASNLYQEALDKGIAKESARFLLPQTLATKIYMTNDLRGWIHYLASRTHESTQLEHREVALAIREELKKHFPETAKAFNWSE
jgi:thymidylate synthase (FAD)